MNRLIGMVLFFGALLAGLAGLSAVFYLAAGVARRTLLRRVPRPAAARSARRSRTSSP